MKDLYTPKKPNYVINKAAHSYALDRFIEDFVEIQSSYQHLPCYEGKDIFETIEKDDMEKLASKLLDNTPLRHRHECISESDNLDTILDLLSAYMQSGELKDGMEVLREMKKTVVDYYEEEIRHLVEEQEKISKANEDEDFFGYAA